jgi:hypothetical protein
MRTTIKGSEREQNESYQKVLAWFFSYPTREVSLNDLTRLVKISKSTAHAVVTRLNKEGFLKIDRLGKVWRIRCDMQHPYNSTRKVAYHMELISESGIIDAILSHYQNPRSIILFGSYRKGDDIETSDIDMAVETLDGEVRSVDFGSVRRIGQRRDVSVSVMQFSRSKVDINLFSNIANGIVLYGFLEARP